MPSLLRGVTLGITVIAGYLFALGRGLPTSQARALAFATLLTGQTLLILVEHTPDSPVWRMRRGGKVLLITLGLMATVTLAAVFLAPSARLMHLEPFPAAGWLAVARVAAVSTLWAGPVKGRRERALPLDLSQVADHANRPSGRQDARRTVWTRRSS